MATASLVSKPSYYPPPKYFLELQIQNVTFLSYFSITVFCYSPPPSLLGKLDLVVSLACIILGSLSLTSHHIYGSRIIHSSSNVCASALDFKDAATLRFGHSNIVFDLLLETSFSHLITLLFNFQIFFSFLGITGPNNLISCRKYHHFPSGFLGLLVNFYSLYNCFL